MKRSEATIQAAVFRGAGEALRVEEFPLPSVEAGEALVELECSTICGSDLHSVRGDRAVPIPTILGHEMIGRIVDLAPGLCAVDGEALVLGDRVSWSIAASCGACFYCQRGLPQKCEALFKYGHQACDGERPLSGGLATHCQLVKGSAIVKVPRELPAAVACPANCATATMVAAFRVAGPCNGEVVLIHGAGMLGLTAAAMARYHGARHVIVNDSRPDRRDRARDFGATATLEDLPGVSSGRGADLVLDCSGAPAAIEHSITQLRIGGRLVLVGAVFPARPLALQAEDLVRKLIRIEGVHNYTPSDLVAAMAFLEAVFDAYPFEELVTAPFPLSEVNEAVEAALGGESLRVAVGPAVGRG